MIQLAMIFREGMVLQGNEPVRVFGTTDRKKVTAGIQGKTAEAEVNEDGSFEVTLPALKYSEKETLTVSDGEEEKVFTDVAVGDVWIAGGQSNMEFQLLFEKHFDEVKPGTGMIRYFDVPEIAYKEALTDYDHSAFGLWRKDDSREELEYFTAVGYYFAKEISAKTGRVIGLIGENWGGINAATWIEPSYVKGTPGEWWNTFREEGLKEAGITEEEAFEIYRKSPMSDRSHQIHVPFDRILHGISHDEQIENAKRMAAVWPEGPHLPPYERKVGRLYETMILPIAPYNVKGAIWYQGESESDHPELVVSLMDSLIRCWRDTFRSKLPFYQVELAAYGKWMDIYGTNYEKVREAQRKICEKLPEVYSVSIMDGGMLWDIHPKDKLIPGVRLAKLALKETYGYDDVMAGSPRVKAGEIETRDGFITIPFTESEGGLAKENGPYTGKELEVFINGERNMIFDGTVEGDKLVIACPFFLPGAKVTVKYGELMYAHVDIFNKAGFSVTPFTVDVEIAE